VAALVTTKLLSRCWFYPELDCECRMESTGLRPSRLRMIHKEAGVDISRECLDGSQIQRPMPETAVGSG